MNKINFIFCLHNHQPNGNFDFVFEKAFQQAYRPFLDVIRKYPTIKITLHYTGVLLEWIEKNHPEFLRNLKALVKSGQVEMLSGGYYEPILSVIPNPDQIGQIQKLTAYVKKVTGYSARGMWLAERVWEPALPKTIRQAGIEFTAIDDTHFKYAGLQNDQLYGYYVTEEQGVNLKIFPISKFLRYSIPFQEPQQTIDYFRSVAETRENACIVFGDDGEKLGIWPETYHHVYENRWLERFLDALQQNADWIEPIHFSDAVQKFSPLGRIYLPTSSYSEMLHWVLPPQAFQKYENFENELRSKGLYEPFENFVRGGFWRNFFAKYPEVNHLHKRMLRVSDRIQDVQQNKSSGKKKEKVVQAAREKLYAAQSNDCYWHGVFGGLYLNYLRTVAYRNLIEAENLLDSLSPVRPIRIQAVDFNSDGQDEFILETPQMNVYFETGEEGAISEIDLKPIAFNLTDVLTRREEGYHHRLANVPPAGGPPVASIHDRIKTKEPNLDQFLFYDRSRRLHLKEQFLEDHENFESYYQGKYHQVFRIQLNKNTFQSGKNRAILRFEKKGEIWYDNSWWPIEVVKNIRVTNSENKLVTDVTLKNRSKRELKFKFGVDLIFTLLAGNAADRYTYIHETNLTDNRLISKGETPEVLEFGAKDVGYLKIDLHFQLSQPATLWRYPLETVSLSEDGFEKGYQGSVFFPNWIVQLQDQWQVELVQQVFYEKDL